jgi:hypothetical protein
VDDVPVWSISCFYVSKGYRKQGITSVLIAALKRARKEGAPALEAYPLDGDITPSASGTGYASTFHSCWPQDYRSPDSPSAYYASGSQDLFKSVFIVKAMTGLFCNETCELELQSSFLL